jgi:hypothetical protein
MQKTRRSTQVPVRWWQPQFSESPDPAVRRAWAEFVTRKGETPYSLGDAIAYLERRVPHQHAGGSGSRDAYGPLGPSLARFLRELRP